MFIPALNETIYELLLKRKKKNDFITWHKFAQNCTEAEKR